MRLTTLEIMHVEGLSDICFFRSFLWFQFQAHPLFSPLTAKISFPRCNERCLRTVADGAGGEGDPAEGRPCGVERHVGEGEGALRTAARLVVELALSDGPVFSVRTSVFF